MKIPKAFFGWSNLKWLMQEITKMYSSKPSFFSKKRVESGIAFWTAEFGMLFYLFKKIETMDIGSLATWSGILFLIAGYHVNQIQKEKKFNKQSETETEEKTT